MMQVPHRIRLAAIATLIALVGCGDGALSPSDRPDSLAEGAAQQGVHEALRWTTSFTSRLEVNKTMRIGARYYDERGRVVASKVVTYQSSDPSIATIDGSGLIRAISPGYTRITASAEGVRSQFQLQVLKASESATRTVISLSDSVVAPGETVSAKAVAVNAAGKIVEDHNAKWSVVRGAPNVATIDKRGEITAIGPGQAVIAATMLGVRDTVVLDVTASDSDLVTAVSLRRTDAGGSTLDIGQTVQLGIEALDASKSVIAGKKVSYRSSAVSIVSVSSAGLLTGVAKGSATITATADGASLELPIVVSAQTSTTRPVATVTVTVGQPSLAVGATTTAVAVATDSAGNSVTGLTATWAVSSASGSVASVDSRGVVTALAAGSAIVTATVQGEAGSATVTVTSGAPSTPPPSGSGIAVAVQRFDGGSGSVLVSNAIPLPKGRLFPADAQKVRVYVNGAEQSVYSEALKGLHADGSLRSVLVQFQYAVPASGSVAGQVVLGQARGTSNLTKPTASRTQLTAVALPTDVNYLLSTELNGPTISVAASKALGGAYAKYESDFVKFADYHWNLNGAAWGENYYDRALIYYAFWVRTANPEFFRRASLLAVNYRRDYLERNSYRSTPHWSQLEGLEQHYLLTGDDASRTAIGRVAESLYGGFHTKLADRASSPWLESRIQARVLQSYLLSWRVQATGRNWASLLDDGLTKVLSTQSADGSYRFPNTCNESLNYMNGLLNDLLIKYYRVYRADSRIPDAIRRSLDYLWTQWNGSAAGFNYISADCLNLSGVWVGLKKPAPDLNNFIVTGFSWYGRYANDVSYSSKAELIFNGGVAGAFLKGTKQFNEEYSASFRHLGFR